MKNSNGIEKINKLCEDVLKLTDTDFEQVKRMAKEQSSYVHPLKNATAKKQHELGDYNTRVVNALYTLRKILKGGADGE